MKNFKNSVHLIGRLGKDPEVKEYGNGKVKASFSLATSDFYKNQQGERVEETQWHQIVTWGKLAEIVREYLKKGNEIVLEGKLVHRTYSTDDGDKRFITEVNMTDMLMLGKKNSEPVEG